MSSPPTFDYDAVIVGGTPAGLMCGITVAKAGRRAVILERTAHIGGLPANGLGATDIHTKGATGGLFLEFVGRVKQHYSDTYGADSPQVKDCSDGYRFEPHVAEKILHEMIADAGDNLEVRRLRQFDHEPSNAIKDGAVLSQIRIVHRETGEEEIYSASVFVDATYEGDLAAAAGAPYMLGREGADEYGEPCAGKFYQRWDAPVDELYSTGQADNAVQSYNYRLALTDNPANMTRISKPATYNRDEYLSLAEDVRLNRFAGPPKPLEFDGIGAITNMARVPNQKVDGNNQHAAFISTDLPEENWPYPTASWDWRDRFAKRLRDYILGLFYFAQNDESLPADFRERCNRGGWPATNSPTTTISRAKSMSAKAGASAASTSSRRMTPSSNAARANIKAASPPAITPWIRTPASNAKRADRIPMAFSLILPSPTASPTASSCRWKSRIC